ncbi:MAG: Jag N-terminal domain-containing protein [Candidatus Omnitrophota bacterium]|nr:Jag N-terminal domain-containing protein [Candidatus Omnitrophota bacterium]
MNKKAGRKQPRRLSPEKLHAGRAGHGKKIIEVEAVTIEEAIRKALKTLHVKKQEVIIDVLKEEHKGLFGMQGAHQAKIRVTIKDHN